MHHSSLPKLALLILFLIAIGALFVPFAISRHKASSDVHTGSTSTSKTAIVSNQANVPVTGSFRFGMYIDTPSPTSIEQAIGHKLNLVGQFVHFNQNMSNSKLAYACQHSYVPVITWESWNGPSHKIPADPYPMNDIVSGKLDGLLRANLESVKNTCGQNTVLVRFDQEFDGANGGKPYYSWQNDPVSYIAAWQHIVKLGRTIDPSIRWVWSPNRANDNSQQYYPGNQWVDYVSLTLNRNGAVARGANAPTSFSQFYEQNKAIENYGKPVIIGETDALEDGSDPQFKADWIRGMFTYARMNTRIVGIVWFNVGGAAYNSSPASIQAFKDSL